MDSDCIWIELREFYLRERTQVLWDKSKWPHLENSSCLWWVTRIWLKEGYCTCNNTHLSASQKKFSSVGNKHFFDSSGEKNTLHTQLTRCWLLIKQHLLLLNNLWSSCHLRQPVILKWGWAGTKCCLLLDESTSCRHRNRGEGVHALPPSQPSDWLCWPEIPKMQPINRQSSFA